MTRERPTRPWGLNALRVDREARRNQLEENAPRREHFIRHNGYYYRGVKNLLRYIVEPGKRVLEIRCATGHLLDAAKPSYGVGVEISDKMVEIARANYPDLHFPNKRPKLCLGNGARVQNGSCCCSGSINVLRASPTS